MIVPVKCGGSSRNDISAIRDSLLQGLGSAVTNQEFSNLWIWCSAFARGVYTVWAVNQNASNQFNPQAMDGTLPLWESFFQVVPLPTDDIQARRDRITAKFALLNQIPNIANITQQLVNNIPVFELLVTVPQVDAIGGYGDGVINGGLEHIVSTNWFSNAANFYVDLHKPDNMTNYQFWQQAYLVFPLLNNYLPAWSSFNWFSSSFNFSDGMGSQATLSVAEGSPSVVGSAGNCYFADGYVDAGGILEAFDDTGRFWRLEVLSITDETHLTLSSNAPATFTNQKFWIQGFFADCSPTDFPYPINSFNNDNAGILP